MTRVVALVAAALALAACATDDPSVTAEQRGKPVVVTTLLPFAEVAARIGGSAVVVIDLTPTGSSPHQLALTPRERGEIDDAALAIVVGKGFQPEAERVAAGREGPTLNVLEELALPDRPGASAGSPDPHVWLDPTIMGSIATAIGDAIAGVAPDDADAIRARAHDIVVDDVQLDAQLRDGLEGCRLSTLATQHEAFGWFAARYGLDEVAFDGAIPDDDPAPDPTAVAAIEPRLRDGSITTLFTDLQGSTSWLEVIAEEHGLDVEVLDPYERVSLNADADATRDQTYRKTMLENLQVLQDELDCDAG